MTNAEFFARNAVARGQKPNVVDINPATGRIRTAFDGLNDERAQRNARVSRSTNGGMTVARPGFPSQPKILGVDAQQAADQEYERDHKDDAFWLQAMQARQNDPNPHIGKMTPEQFKAAVQAHDPTGKLAPAMGIKPPAPANQDFTGGTKIGADGQLLGVNGKPLDPAFAGGAGGFPVKPAMAPPAPAPPPQPGIPLAGTPANVDPVRVVPPRGYKPPVGADGVPEAIRRPVVTAVLPMRRKKPDGSYDDGTPDVSESHPDEIEKLSDSDNEGQEQEWA